MGDMLSSAYQQAQIDMGIFAPKTVSVGDLFAGALLPGLLLVAALHRLSGLQGHLRPAACPAHAAPAEAKAFRRRDVVVALMPPLALIIAVLGSILGGIATPTEAAAVGAVGAMLLAALRWRLSLPRLREVVHRTADRSASWCS